MALVECKDSSATTHGLSNDVGENNCFVNSVIQILWHLDIFRNHFGQIQQHMCYELECVFCTLKELFVNFQYSEAITLPPNFIRKAMAKCYRESGRFQLSTMDYAVECYEAVLQQIHSQITGTDWNTTCTHPKCLPHKIFSYSSCQIDMCGCGATSEPFPSEDILFYISADNLLKAVKRSKKSQKEILRNGTVFGGILRESLSTDKKHKCPESSSCKKSARIETMLLRSPYTINLSLSWSSDTSSKERVVEVLKSVGHIINISQMFTVSLDETAENKAYHLSGIVNYYGHHFSAFVYNTNLGKWVFCDDASFRTVGEDWDEVVQLTKRARYQPELLIYSTRDIDIWVEEKKRKPLPKIPPKPNIATLISSSVNLSNMSDPQVAPGPDDTAPAVPSAPLLPPPFDGGAPIHPTAPPITNKSNLYPSLKMQPSPNPLLTHPHMMQQQSPVPSAPPAIVTSVGKSNPFYRIAGYPQPPSQAAKPNKSNPRVSSSQSPVVLVSFSPKTERATPVSPPDMVGFETISHPGQIDGTKSAPNLLLDMPTPKPVSKPDKKKKVEDNLIDFAYIPAIRADDLYEEFFPKSSNKPNTS